MKFFWVTKVDSVLHGAILTRINVCIRISQCIYLIQQVTVKRALVLIFSLALKLKL